MSSVDLVVQEADASHAGSLRDLFDACSCPCHCRYWEFEGDKNAWLERCAFSPDDNAAAMRASLEEPDAPLRGLVALVGDRAVGWMKLTHASSIQKLVTLGPYRRFRMSEESALVIGCFLVDPEYRERGIARRLIEAAPSIAQAHGASAIVAYPIDPDEGSNVAHLWRGATPWFKKAGFEQIGGEAPYPILRVALGSRFA